MYVYLARLSFFKKISVYLINKKLNIRKTKIIPATFDYSYRIDFLP